MCTMKYTSEVSKMYHADDDNNNNDSRDEEEEDEQDEQEEVDEVARGDKWATVTINTIRTVSDSHVPSAFTRGQVMVILVYIIRRARKQEKNICACHR